MTSKHERELAMRVWLYSDEYATLASTQVEEYEEIESRVRDMLPGVKLTFERDKKPTDLNNGSADAYIFDIGGLFYADHNGERRLSWCREVMRQAEERPSTLFVPWSSMTGTYLRSAIQQLMPEWDDPDADLPEPRSRPNVWLPTKDQGLDWYKLPGLEEKLKSWVP